MFGNLQEINAPSDCFPVVLCVDLSLDSDEAVDGINPAPRVILNPVNHIPRRHQVLWHIKLKQLIYTRLWLHLLWN